MGWALVLLCVACFAGCSATEENVIANAITTEQEIKPNGSNHSQSTTIHGIIAKFADKPENIQKLNTILETVNLTSSLNLSALASLSEEHRSHFLNSTSEFATAICEAIEKYPLASHRDHQVGASMLLALSPAPPPVSLTTWPTAFGQPPLPFPEPPLPLVDTVKGVVATPQKFALQRQMTEVGIVGATFVFMVMVKGMYDKVYCDDFADRHSARKRKDAINLKLMGSLQPEIATQTHKTAESTNPEPAEPGDSDNSKTGDCPPIPEGKGKDEHDEMSETEYDYTKYDSPETITRKKEKHPAKTLMEKFKDKSNGAHEKGMELLMSVFDQAQQRTVQSPEIYCSSPGVQSLPGWTAMETLLGTTSAPPPEY